MDLQLVESPDVEPGDTERELYLRVIYINVLPDI